MPSLSTRYDDRLRYLIIALVVMGGVSVYFWTEAVENTPDPADDVTERIWADLPLKRVDTAPAADTSLLRPYQIYVYDDHVYVVDGGDHTVKVFDMTGQLARTIGRGEGQGPGEFMHLIDAVLYGDYIWLADAKQRKLSKYTRTGRHIADIQVDRTVQRINRLDEDLVLLVHGGKTLFQRVDTTGEVVDQFGQIGEGGPAMSIQAYGDFVPRPNGGFLYVTTKDSRLYWFDAEGNQERRVVMRDGLDFPTSRMQETEQGTHVSTEDPPIRYYRPSITGDTINVFSVLAERVDYRHEPSVIDRYDLETGEYIDSIRFPDVVQEGYMADDHLVGYYRDTLRIYKIAG